MEIESAMIELPGEANPLTEGILFHVLKSASSSDRNQVQTGTQQLQKWEAERGFYPLLQSVFVDKALPLEVRYLAIIQLKNGIDRYWRKTATNAVSKEDKAIIRARLLESGVNEANQRLALQNALVVAKIVRFEYPNEWPDVVVKLLEILRASFQPGSNHLHLPRSLQILLYVIKELATGRLLRTRQNLQSIAPEIFHVLGQIYDDKVRRWREFLQHGGDDEGGALEDIELSLLSIKVLRRLLDAGFEFPNRDSNVQEFWIIIRGHLEDFLRLVTVQDSPLSTEVQRLIEKHLMQLSKLHLDMATTHPAGFVLLPDTLPIVKAYWGLIVRFGDSFGSKSAVLANGASDDDADEDEKPIMERFTLKALLIMRACLKMVFNPTNTFKYRHPEEKAEKAQALHLVKVDLLTELWVREVMETLVTKFFVLRDIDLRDWQEEPEEWEKREDIDGADFEFSVRPCAEKLFLDLAINFKELIIPPLLHVFRSVATPVNENMLFKDSVYTAIGLAAAVLNHHLDFDSFISSTLAQEAQIARPGFGILRRRIAILIGQWISVKCSDESRPLVYNIFHHLLNKADPLNDLVVRITAGKQLKNVADDWEFKPESFLPFASDILSRLMSLIEEARSTDTKMALLNTISVVVERLEHHITPYAERIVNILPPLWDQSGEEHLMKQAILTILARLINSMKAESVKYHSLVLPIIKGAVEPGSETQVYLLEDALELWSSIVCQTSAPASTDLIGLAPYLLSVYESGSENLRKALEITESYVLLAPSDILSDGFRIQLLRALSSLLGNLRPDANGLVTGVVEVLVRAADGLGREQAVELIVSDMIRTELFTKLLLGLRGSWEAHQRTGPNASAPVVDGVVETDYFSVLARIGLVSPSILIEAISSVASTSPVHGTTPESIRDTMKWLLEEWFSHLENIGAPDRRKLMALALTRLLESNAEWMLVKLQDLMTMWTDVITELTDGHDDKTIDSLVYSSQDSPSLHTDPEAPEDFRRRELLFSDPVHNINLIAYVRDKLKDAIEVSGGEEMFRTNWLVNVDKDIAGGFGRLGVL